MSYSDYAGMVITMTTITLAITATVTMTTVGQRQSQPSRIFFQQQRGQQILEKKTLKTRETSKQTAKKKKG